MLTREAVNLRAWLLITILASIIINAILLSQSKISVDYASLRPAATSLTVLILTGIICARRQFHSWAHVMETLAIGIVLSILGLIASYLATSLGRPLADEILVDADRAVGFDGAAFIRRVDSQPWVAWLLMQAYASFAFQLVLLPIILILARQAARGFGLVLAYAIVCFVASFVSIWFPAVAANITYGIDGTSLRAINAQFGLAFLEQFHAVRDQDHFVLSLNQAQGILTFPSVHTATAVVCAACMLSLRWLRYPILLLNICMITSTLTHGGHYLVDVLAGVVLALAALLLVKRLAVTAPPILHRRMHNLAADDAASR